MRLLHQLKNALQPRNPVEKLLAALAEGRPEAERRLVELARAGTLTHEEQRTLTAVPTPVVLNALASQNDQPGDVMLFLYQHAETPARRAALRARLQQPGVLAATDAQSAFSSGTPGALDALLLGEHAGEVTARLRAERSATHQAALLDLLQERDPNELSHVPADLMLWASDQVFVTNRTMLTGNVTGLVRAAIERMSEDEQLAFARGDVYQQMTVAHHTRFDAVLDVLEGSSLPGIRAVVRDRRERQAKERTARAAASDAAVQAALSDPAALTRLAGGTLDEQLAVLTALTQGGPPAPAGGDLEVVHVTLARTQHVDVARRLALWPKLHARARRALADHRDVEVRQRLAQVLRIRAHELPGWARAFDEQPGSPRP